MVANMKLIEAKTLGSNASTVVFTSIPQTYTDLVLLVSARTNASYTADTLYVTMNSSTSNFTWENAYSTGSSVPVSQTNTDNQLASGINGNSSTASVFSNVEIYIPNYRNTAHNKSITVQGVVENNATRGDNYIDSVLWNDTSSITSMTLAPIPGGSFVTNSTFYLYGITSAVIDAKATGGTIYQDDTYFYHVFGTTGTFTPSQSLTCDTLVVAGGGGGGRTGGGGGAGGLRGLTSQSFASGTAYTITVGAGGAGNNTDGQQAGDGTTSSITGTGFTAINTTGGGGAASYGATSGRSGGSGGGGSAGIPNSSAGAGNAGGYTPVEGFAGGTGTTDSQRGGGGGGGGASEAGQSTTTGAVRRGGKGGNGSSAFSSWGVATGTGQNVSGIHWYAGGGGAASDVASLRGLGGYGGGGDAGTNTNPSNSVPGMANTGGGGGANSGNYPAGANGGSGLVIIRYAI